MLCGFGVLGCTARAFVVSSFLLGGGGGSQHRVPNIGIPFCFFLGGVGGEGGGIQKRGQKRLVRLGG